MKIGLTDRIAAAAGLVTAAGMIATPLLPQRSTARRVLSSVVVTGLFVNTTANATRRWGVARASTAAGVIGVATAAVERVGTQTGLPFGRYAYTKALRPQVASVPVIVPLAWFAMSLPARETAHAAIGNDTPLPLRLAAGSAAMTAWDLFLDPQMVGEGYWAWVRHGVYRGIPLSNFVGWFATGLAVMAALEVLLPPTADEAAESSRPDTRRRAGDGRLIGTYTYMSIMETVGFARYFRDPVVAVVGGLAMLPIAATALVRRTIT